MRKGIQSLIAGWAFGLASQAMSTAHFEADEFADDFNPCRHHLNTLVAYLKETAQLEGKRCSAEWRPDGSVVIRCSDFSQYMWCHDGELHVRFGDPILSD